MNSQFPRMLSWALLTVVLIIAALFFHGAYPGTLLAVTLYKAHLMALGGWGGYWLDRALFPYARPDAFLRGMATDRTALVFNAAQTRRAIIVAACLICVGLGA